ncbi:MAG TPA: chorismate-binding protein [Actinomycetes bacterium]|nr:chorismate-binding protein [Actinomycetes bacterium]
MSSSSGDPYAWFGGRLATGLADVTDDLSALDGAGWWAVVIDFEGVVRCARFDEVREGALPPGRWPGVPADGWASSMTREQYVAAVGLVRDGIAVGDHYQANLCRVLTTDLPSGPEPAAMSGLAALLAEGNPAPYAGVVHLPAHDITVVSASPELFLRRDGDDVESGPIKGTARTAAGLTDKDRAENVMIVDLVRNDLGAVAVTGSVEVPALCAVEEHPGLVHLVSRVSARLRAGAGWPELVAASFPPGSVTGAPKSAALDAIRSLEPVPRGPYCGAVGWVDADRRTAALAVGIRTFWLTGGRLHFGTGAGITWGSDAAREWDETELKARRLLAVAAQAT